MKETKKYENRSNNVVTEDRILCVYRHSSYCYVKYFRFITSTDTATITTSATIITNASKTLIQ